MKGILAIRNKLLLVCVLAKLTMVHAGAPLWSFTPLTATQIAVPINSSAMVQYIVSNQSNRTHILEMSPIAGVSQITTGNGICRNPFTLAAHASCVLSLQINGSQIHSENTHGPVVCEAGSALQCYRPSPINFLDIRVVPGQYSLGGTISGLNGTVYLQNNGLNPQPFSSDGSFTLATDLASGTAYDVTVQSQPSGQTCSVSNGTGIITNENVTNINVVCATNAYTVGGTVSGLSGTVILLNNGGDANTVTTNGSFTFSTPVAEGSSYNVTVGTQPSGQTCTVSNGSGTMGSSNVSNVSVICVQDMTTLSASISTLALSVNDTNLNAALTGNSRLITISNTGGNPASNVTYSPSPALPSGTSISPASCGDIAPSASCVLTITPGSTASAAAGDTSPTPITLSIAGDNTNTLTSTVNILTYGSVYQGGYVYSVDDTTPNTGSIGGKVVTLSNQMDPQTGIIWSANMDGSTSRVAIYAISDSSTTSSPNPSTGQISGQTACNGKTSGSCDSNNINVYYSTIPWNLYALGLCKSTINGYNDWYLPANCEMCYSGGASILCGRSSSPLIQNMCSSLVDNGNIGGLSGSYWSATEVAGNATNNAWIQLFSLGSNSQGNADKGSLYGVRCSRALTL